jgi:hypothetical protein
MTAFATNPGLYFTVAPRPPEASPLRSDVAAFIGRTRRGPVGQPVRVEQWQGYMSQFGGLLKDSSTTYATAVKWPMWCEYAVRVRRRHP